MPVRTIRTSISIDSDLLAPAKEKSQEFSRFGEENLSAYISSLIRKDLGMAAQSTAKRPVGKSKQPSSAKPSAASKLLDAAGEK